MYIKTNTMDSLKIAQKTWPKTYQARAVVYLLQHYSLIYLAVQTLVNENELGREFAKLAVSKMIKRQSKKYTQ